MLVTFRTATNEKAEFMADAAPDMIASDAWVVGVDILTGIPNTEVAAEAELSNTNGDALANASAISIKLYFLN
jgi:hypothetical protein